jgi:hypothetical protein
MKKTLLLSMIVLLAKIVNADAWIYSNNQRLPNPVMSSQRDIVATSITENAIYTLNKDDKDTNLMQCDIYGLNCQVIDTFKNYTPVSVSFNSDGDGVVGVRDNSGLAIYKQNKFVNFANDPFITGVRSVSLTKSGVYVINGYSELWKCDTNGISCKKLDFYNNNKPISVSFNDNGDGVVGVSNNGIGLAIYRQDKFTGYANDTFSKGVRSVSLTKNGIFVLNGYDESWKCTVNGENCSKLNVNDVGSEISTGFSFNSEGNGIVSRDYSPVPSPSTSAST